MRPPASHGRPAGGPADDGPRTSYQWCRPPTAQPTESFGPRRGPDGAEPGGTRLETCSAEVRFRHAAIARALLLAPALLPGAAALTPSQRQTLALQVQLDRAHFSPGEIDGRGGSNTRAAQAAFTAAGLDARRRAGDHDLHDHRRRRRRPVRASPEDLMEQSKLPALGYASILEALGERFHASPALLKALNPRRRSRPASRSRCPTSTHAARRRRQGRRRPVRPRGDRARRAAAR